MALPRRGMWFREFQDLVERNKLPAAIIRFYRDERINKNQIAIFDRHLPRRKGYENFRGYEEEDHWTNSHVCELAIFGNEVPMVGSLGRRDPISDKLIEPMYRGVLAALETMLNEGCLRRTDELRQLFSDHGRPFPKPPPA